MTETKPITNRRPTKEDANGFGLVQLDIGSGYDELRPLYNELKKLFDTGIR